MSLWLVGPRLTGLAGGYTSSQLPPDEEMMTLARAALRLPTLCGQTFEIDVHTGEPLQLTPAMHSAALNGQAALWLEKRKHDELKAHFTPSVLAALPNTAFVPFGVTTYGETGPGADFVIELLAAFAEERGVHLSAYGFRALVAKSVAESNYVARLGYIQMRNVWEAAVHAQKRRLNDALFRSPPVFRAPNMEPAHAQPFMRCGPLPARTLGAVT